MIVELILVRHALAFERNRSRWPDDQARPLSPEGKQKFRKAAAGLARWLPKVDCVLTSPLVRARQTADLLTERAGWPRAQDCAQLAPEQKPDALLEVVRQQKASRIALVGHEPSLSTLAALCLGSPSPGTLVMKKGGLLCITFEARPGAGKGTLTAFVPPRALRAMQ